MTGDSCNSVTRVCDFCVSPAGTHTLHLVFLAGHLAEESHLVAETHGARTRDGLWPASSEDLRPSVQQPAENLTRSTATGLSMEPDPR